MRMFRFDGPGAYRLGVNLFMVLKYENSDAALPTLWIWLKALIILGL